MTATVSVVLAESAIREAIERTRGALLDASGTLVASLNGGHVIPVDCLWQLVDTATALLNHTCSDDAFRTGIAAAVHLPGSTPAAVLLAEVEARFSSVVRAVVGHAFLNGEDLCECEQPVNRADWIDHVEALRAQGVPTATISSTGDGA